MESPKIEEGQRWKENRQERIVEVIAVWSGGGCVMVKTVEPYIGSRSRMMREAFLKRFSLLAAKRGGSR